MKRVPPILRCAILFTAMFAFFEYGLPLVTAPLPSSLVLMYCGMSAAAILLYVSVREERWREFFRPVVRFLRDDEPPSRAKRFARGALLILLPPAVGAWAYVRASAPPEPPADPPGIHFSLPNKYVGVENPLPWTEENIREGGVLYTRNCAMCHGDAQDGNGLFARAWQPRPANFRDSGTIAQLDENYLFWRIKEGGPGLPKGSIDYRSAMPVWDGVLTDDQIWKIIMFEYANAGVKPAKRE